MNVFVTSCETHPGAWRHNEERLRELYSYSSQRHALVDDPAQADVILIGNLREENGFRSLRTHPVVNRFPAKSFGLSEADEPVPLLRGVYTSAHTRLPFQSRYRSGSYTLYHSDFRNPYIEAYEGWAYDRPKEYDFSFTGRDSHPARAEILWRFTGYPGAFVKDTSSFNLFTHRKAGKAESQEFFVKVLEKSKFAVCPRGSGAASIRLFEAMQIGVAPVIIADDWVFPRGPDWRACAIILKEREVAHLANVIRENEPRYVEMGRAAAKAYQQFFSREAYFDYLIDQVEDIRRRQKVPEVLCWKLRGVAVWERRLMKKVSSRFRAIQRRRDATARNRAASRVA